ncbi:MAG: HEAT repeat domain-containing protein [Planctomycetes bacterium]|nr:HEAT repeat domain-containing protein [Planctomycetota bacterium]
MAALLALLNVLQTPAELVRKLGDDSFEVRNRSTRRLRDIGEEALPELEAVAGESDLEVQTRARQLIRWIRAEACFDPRLIRRYPDLSEALLKDDIYAVLGRARRSSLSPSPDFDAYAGRLLERDDLRARKAATWLFARDLRNPRRGAPQFIRSIEGWDPETCEDRDRAWLKELIRLALDRVSEADRPMLERAAGGHWASRQCIALLQTAVGIPEGVPTTVELLAKGSPWLRGPAILAARRGRCVEALPALVPLLAVPDLGGEAAMALLEIGDESCGPAVLVQLGELTERQWPPHAAELLARYRDGAGPATTGQPAPIRTPPTTLPEEPPRPEGLPGTADELLKLLAAWDAALPQRLADEKGVIKCGMSAMYETRPIGGDAILSALAATVDRSLWDLFVERLSAPDREVQREAIRVCGAWKLPDAAPILRRLVRVGAPDVRAAAQKALDELEKK